MNSKLTKILRNIVFAFGLIYGVNVLLSKVSICLPLNIYTVSIVSILGVPGLITIFCIFFLVN